MRELEKMENGWREKRKRDRGLRIRRIKGAVWVWAEDWGDRVTRPETTARKTSAK